LGHVFRGWCASHSRQFLRPAVHQDQISRQGVRIDGTKDIFASNLQAIQRVARQSRLSQHGARDQQQENDHRESERRSEHQWKDPLTRCSDEPRI